MPSFGTPRTTGGERLSSRSSKMPQTRMSAPAATSAAMTASAVLAAADDHGAPLGEAEVEG